MNEPAQNRAAAILRAWLRNERRLGIAHVGVLLRTAQASQAAAGGGRTEPAGRSGPRVRSAAAPPRAAARAGDQGQPAVGSKPVSVGEDGLPAFVTQELREPDARAALAALDAQFVQGCTRCELCAQRTQTVFGIGHARPELVFVGEGPGADEDRQGVPFVGRAGQLLTRMIAAMTLTRDQVYICNVVKCRPPGNRTPTDDEMQTCSPYLMRQLAILRPRVIVTLGRPAAQTLLQTKTPIGKLRGAFHDFPPPAFAYPDVPRCKLMPTFHPAYLLRSPGEKGKAWSDLQQVMEFLGIPVPRRRS